MNKLLLAILKGTWAIEPKIALSYGPFIAGLINGQDVKIDREPLNIFAVSRSGDQESEFDNTPSGSTAIIPIKGEMLKYDTLCSYGTESLAGLIKEAADHQNINSAILDVDSGGGEVAAVSPVLKSIEYFRSKGKKIIGVADTCCSAANWGISGCDEIWALNDITSMFGSLGIEGSFMDFLPYYKKMGLVMHTIHPPESKDKNAWFAALLKGDYSLINEEILSPLAKSFQATMIANRPMLKKDVEGLLTGKTFYAKDSMKYGLIDRIGTMDEAISHVQELARNYSQNSKIKSKLSITNIEITGSKIEII